MSPPDLPEPSPDLRRYTFEEVGAADLPRLRDWVARPHVAEWWDDDEPFRDEDLADPRVDLRLVSFDGRPFAFMQDYDVRGWVGHYFGHLPPGSRGIDQFIAEPDMVGIGHGPAFISLRIKELFDGGAPAVATDPHPDNKRAVAAYEKVGFRATGEPMTTQWGLILPMVFWRKSL
ncbi:putative aminoglycoside N(6')-acetyltransferase [Fulvimarina pelagi HTCC2506]|uniref:Putative aminoglycoside N(6')-acetyltransferase n=2 Tax=Fulvimarina pelagi TaxID=217511 RepID=Q0G0A5_9HYPH|nr:GNAT family N-acetyltransferase [Fulvimarina pelagi]EAU40688.1 putative aminoglycoside N(6')-acetyltransferase [Fulvimarina pelagi HTCC2506]BAT31231.1 putative aminoglycoside N(6')-acetyltransferase [Fulvimarina pelagi]